MYRDNPYKEIEAVTFHDTLVEITMNLTRDFQVSELKLQKEEKIETSDSQELSYTLDFYQCQEKPDGTFTDKNSPLDGTNIITQNTILYICLDLDENSENVGIREIEQLEFTQPETQNRYYAIYSRTPNAITSERHCGSPMAPRKKMVVSTRIVLPFFEEIDEGYYDSLDPTDRSIAKVIARGIVIVQFQNDETTRRHLANNMECKFLTFDDRRLRSLLGDETKEVFEIELEIQMGVESSRSQSTRHYNIGALIFTFIFVSYTETF